MYLMQFQYITIILPLETLSVLGFLRPYCPSLNFGGMFQVICLHPWSPCFKVHTKKKVTILKFNLYYDTLPAGTATWWQRCDNVLVKVVTTLCQGRKWELWRHKFPAILRHDHILRKVHTKFRRSNFSPSYPAKEIRWI